MKIRLALTLDIERKQPPAAERHEHRDNGTLVEHGGQPRYVGFNPDPIAPEDAER